MVYTTSGCGLLGKFTSSGREQLESVSGSWGAQSVLETGAVQEEEMDMTTSMFKHGQVYCTDSLSNATEKCNRTD